ncbi:ATP-binding protein [Bradyrhizobium brasilense]|uniref:ATP-binding protein n=1 Tax=Bradyrhizobium brasilense TaxID=1419277 RepID=A0ABY8JW62_9BRAD|nr:ATP-binding protein [Bradyrhizobium brasilense]WFU68263.1 ATP-binding protein [Bradyrhizobium brasilense]
MCGLAGVGKSWPAPALGHKACRENHSVLYQRVLRLFDNLALARRDGRYRVLTRAFSTAARAGAVKDARLRARQGLSLTAPSTPPG